MKIAIVSPCFGAFGGIESFVCALGCELASHEGLEVTLCFKKTKGFKLDALLEEAAAETKAKVVFADRASRTLAKVIQGADLVHCQNPCFDVAVLAKFFRKPLALTIHNWRRPHLRAGIILRNIAFRLADVRWYNSSFVWNTWEPEGKLAGSDKLPMISNLPKGSVPPEQRKGFLFLGRWIANKGIDTLVDAYAQARINREEWSLILLGDGPLRPAIEQKIREQGIPGIEIRGKVNDAARDDAIRHARWMVTPPNTKEDLGLTPLEARHVGVPCIVTRDGGLPEAGGKYALLCEPGDATGLAGCLETAAKMGEEGYKELSRATHEELLQSLQPMSVYVNRYRQLIERAGKQPDQ
jgi:glycosyltransferase involved in cell wall biosynthesis